MSDDNPADRPRRGSFTSQAFSSIFGPRNSINGNGAARTNGTSTSGSSTNGTSTNGTSTTAPQQTPNSRRRMSISTLGLSGSPININPTPPFFPRDRRASVASTASSNPSNPSSSISESAIEDDSPDTAHSVPTTPFSRHMSFGGTSTLFPRANGAPQPTSPKAKSRSPSDSPGLNWSEQFRERAASAVHRPQMGSSPPGMIPHVRARSEGGSEGGSPPQTQTQVQMPQQQQPQISVRQPVKKERRKPDEVGERMLRGEFYMD